MAVCAIDAKHQSGRPRCGAFPRSIFRAADTVDESFSGISFGSRAFCVFVCKAAQAVSISGNCVFGQLRGVHSAAWEELLSGTDLSDARCRGGVWSSMMRSKHEAGLAEAGNRCRVLAGGAVLAPIVIPVFRQTTSSRTWQSCLSSFREASTAMSAPFCRSIMPTSSDGKKSSRKRPRCGTHPSQQRKDCGVFAQDYGQAGAIDFLGRKYGLPPALSGHQTWWLWGPRGYTGSCLIVLDDDRERLERSSTRSRMPERRRTIRMLSSARFPSSSCTGQSSGRCRKCGPD